MAFQTQKPAGGGEFSSARLHSTATYGACFVCVFASGQGKGRRGGGSGGAGLTGPAGLERRPRKIQTPLLLGRDAAVLTMPAGVLRLRCCLGAFSPLLQRRKACPAIRVGMHCWRRKVGRSPLSLTTPVYCTSESQFAKSFLFSRKVQALSDPRHKDTSSHSQPLGLSTAQ